VHPSQRWRRQGLPNLVLPRAPVNANKKQTAIILILLASDSGGFIQGDRPVAGANPQYDQP
jgi:hypothetical protein